ncbi:putative integral membrane protein [Psychrobacter aquaticus CMS 56]|uniref:Putative integral membrane protein n=2 Tax=Psychrobacter TaxID=497 RepID=U4T7M0_9GAMM|nr:putative integral membrane protein [Psychrobacter aquaticus CMS 56]
MYSRFNAITVSTITIFIVMVLASIEPLEWSSYLLHQLGTLLFLALMLSAYHYRYISSRSYVFASLFLIIHVIGARYLYSYVPYDDWTQQLVGVRLNELFGWQRNMYDRLVHFSYGLLLFIAMVESAKSIFTIQSTKLLVAVALMMNMSSILLYELLEWGIATTLSPEAAEAYNGQQGDVWDTHKDMALALLGGLIAAGIVLFQTRKIK